MESKKRLKILIFSWRGPGHPNAGGAEISTHEHAKAWVKAGNSVTLFTSFYSGAIREEIIDGVTIIRSGRQNFGVHFDAFKWYLSKKHSGFDIVIDQFHGIPFFTPLYIKEKKLAFIHEVTKEVWKLNQWPLPLNFVVAILGSLIEPIIFKLYTNVPFMTVSESTKSDLIGWGIPAKHVTVIHNGINMPKLKTVFPKENKNTLIYLGAIAKDKGIEIALETFLSLNKGSSDWQFWIVGKASREYLNQLKTRIKILGLEKKSIKFWGFVDEEKKFELLSKSHLLVNPSIREGWGLVVIEAAAVGTPTIAFNVPGLRDSVVDGKTGLLSKQMTADSLAQAAIKLINDENKLKQMSKEAFIWSKNFSWEKASKLSLNLIRKVAG